MAKQETIVLGLGDMAVTSDTESALMCLGLGSCIAVSAYDPISKIAGMAHVVLPRNGGRETKSSAKYVDTAIPHLFEEMKKQGAITSRLVVKIAGGARMSLAPGLDRSGSGNLNRGISGIAA